MAPRETDHLYISKPHTSHNDPSLHVTTQPMSANGHATGSASHSSGMGAIATGYAANSDYYNDSSSDDS